MVPQLPPSTGLPADLAAGLAAKFAEERLRETQGAIVCAFSHLLDLRDLNTGVHSTRLAEWAVRVCVQFGLDEEDQRNVEVACLLHDIGKVGIEDAILKKAGPLTEAERRRMNRHPEYSWAIFRLFPHLERAGLYALHHHEQFDGSGYPAGLRGDRIPFGARLVAVVDAFDAMVSDRVYRKGLPMDEALGRLVAGAGTQFDPEVVTQFVAMAPAHIEEVRRIAEPARPIHLEQEAVGY